jgi:predicted transposase YdaD
VIRLVVESPQEVVNSARFLLNKAKREIVDALIQQQIVELIETIVLYKFPQMTRQELEAMFRFKELK